MACRLLYYTSLAFGEAASLAVEVAAARQGNVHGYALCSMATDAAFAEVTRVEEGGSQFEEGTERFVGNASDYKQAPFFATARAFGVDAVEHATIHDVLSTDARFASSFSMERFDDFVADAQGNSLEGLVRLPPADAGEGARRGGNCALITGRWQRGRRYRIHVDMRNPPDAETAGRPAAAAWIAPLTYTKAQDGKSMRFSIRGYRYGAVCAPAPALVGRLDFRDSCAHLREVLPRVEEYVRNTAQPAGAEAAAVAAGGAALALGNATAAAAGACEAVLQALVGTAANVTGTQAAAALAAPDAGPATCPSGTRRAVRGGSAECVACAPGAGDDCACPPDRPQLPVGAAACSPPRFGGANSTSQALKLLCESLTRAQDGSAAALARGAVGVSASSAEEAIDEHVVLEANATFWARYALDPRMADNPTRRHTGLAPRCAGCAAAGEVEPGDPLDDHDLRFRSLAALRVAGLAISAAGVPCETLAGTDVLVAARDTGAEGTGDARADAGTALRLAKAAYGPYEDQYMCDPLPQ